MKKFDIKIVIALHKKYNVPKSSIYLPLHVGSYKKDGIGYERDDSGDNISDKNPYFCELTALYWAWKNMNNDYIGLVHYRRYFGAEKINKKDLFGSVIDYNELSKYLKNYDIILPKKRKYYIEDLYSHYKHTMYIEPLDITRNIISEKYSEYLSEFDKLHKRRSAHMFNMFIMKKEYLNQYCEWLFDILGEVEKRVDSSQYSDFHKRFYGRISERLLDVWIKTNKLNYKEIPVIDMQNINWKNKIKSFLVAKFTGKKYEKSF